MNSTLVRYHLPSAPYVASQIYYLHYAAFQIYYLHQLLAFEILLRALYHLYSTEHFYSNVGYANEFLSDSQLEGCTEALGERY